MNSVKAHSAEPGAASSVRSDGWVLVDVYRVGDLTLTARQAPLPGATLYRVNIDERSLLAAVFVVTGVRPRKSSRWREAPNGDAWDLPVSGGSLVVERKDDAALGFHAYFARGRA